MLDVWCSQFASACVFSLHEAVVQQKVENADVQHAVVVIPALADIMTDNDLLFYSTPSVLKFLRLFN